MQVRAFRFSVSGVDVCASRALPPSCPSRNFTICCLEHRLRSRTHTVDSNIQFRGAQFMQCAVASGNVCGTYMSSAYTLFLSLPCVSKIAFFVSFILFSSAQLSGSQVPYGPCAFPFPSPSPLSTTRRVSRLRVREGATIFHPF